MAGKSEYGEGTVKYSVRLPPSIAKWCVGLGGTLAKGIIESHRILTLVDDTPVGVDSARAYISPRIGYVLTEEEIAVVRANTKQGDYDKPIAWADGTPINLEEVGTELRTQFPEPDTSKLTLPPIYQGGVDVSPRFKDQGKKTSEVHSEYKGNLSPDTPW